MGENESATLFSIEARLLGSDSGCLPEASEAEMALLGRILQEKSEEGQGSNSLFTTVRSIVQQDDFVIEAHKAIFGAMLKLDDKGDPVDIVSVNQQLKDRDQLKKIGGTDYLVALTESVPSKEGWKYYAALVAEKARLRAMGDKSHAITKAVTDGGDMDHVALLIDRLNSIPAPIGGGHARNELKPVPIGELTGGKDLPWVWHGWLAKGYVTLMVGLWKAGKSTLLSYILRDSSAGGDIAGVIEKTNWLVVSEEGDRLWSRRRDELGIANNVEVMLRPFGGGRPNASQWKAFIRRIAGWIKEGKYDAVAFDPLQSLSPCRDENDSVAMMDAILPFHQITEAGAAVLVTHHPRKGDGNEGTSARGSGALSGFVDVIAELRRHRREDANDTRRTLKGLSRFEETPREVVLDLTESGYQTIGTGGEARHQDRTKVIDQIMEKSKGTVTSDAVQEAWPENMMQPGARTIRQDLTAGYKAGRWTRIGDGVKGDPFRYGKDSFLAGSPSIGARKEKIVEGAP